jgi:hypothetical protein
MWYHYDGAKCHKTENSRQYCSQSIMWIMWLSTLWTLSIVLSCLKYEISENRLFLRFQVEAPQLGLVDGTSLCLRTPESTPEAETSRTCWAKHDTFHLMMKSAQDIDSYMSVNYGSIKRSESCAQGSIFECDCRVYSNEWRNSFRLISLHVRLPGC